MHGTYKNGIYTKREDESQKLRMAGGAWSVNLDEMPIDTRLIEFITPEQTYVISREDAVKYGFIRMLGGEKKLVVPLHRWQKGAVALSD